jgi:pyridoxamine 5'-phosphate oxidase
MDLSHLREEYALESLEIDDADANPYQQFEKWYRQASEAELLEPNAMVLSTVDTSGRPAQRTVLLKYFDEHGFVFYTNYSSRKAKHIQDNSSVSLLFQWLPLQRQVEIAGVAEKVSAAESLKYFMSRPRSSQLGAWVSRQSEVITSRSVLEGKMQEVKKRFSAGEIPLPSFWGGFRVKPQHLEFWQGRKSRLHDRILYLPSPNGQWERSRLSP